MNPQQEAREQARHKASVMIAFAEGKEIRSRFKTHPHPPWIDDLNPRWDFVAVEYEVKPEERKPREWKGMWTNGRYLREKHPYTNAEAAAVYGWHQVVVVEVLPSENTGENQ